MKTIVKAFCIAICICSSMGVSATDHQTLFADTLTQPSGENAAAFIIQSIENQEQELLIATLAITKSSNVELQKLSARIISEQENFLSQLNSFREQYGQTVLVVTQPNDGDNSAIMKLKAAGGDSFDKKWLDAMITINEKTIQDYSQNAAKDVTASIRKMYKDAVEQLLEQQKELEAFRNKQS